MVSIEWEREELYSYFLKLILAKSKDEFFSILKSSDIAGDELKNEIIKSSKGYNQIPLIRSLLEPLVSLIFGKEVKKGNIFLGTSYEYFYFNFKNANDTISIRPFINLISQAATEALSKNNIPYYYNNLPIINSNFYLNSEFRDLAVDEHFSDLTNEGNHELKFIVQYLRDNTEYKQQYLTSTELQAFLNGVIETFQDNELNGKNYKDLQELLEANGIIAEQIKPDGRIYYFAMLYKFWLGLKNRKYVFGKSQKSLFTGSDFAKIEAHFRNKLKTEGIYQQSLIGTMIYEATKRKWSEVFEYPDYDSFLESLQEMNIIEIKEQSKFKFLKSLSVDILNKI
jgi:hypothetical protein